MDQATTPAEPTIVAASNNPGPGLLFTKIPSVASFAVGLLLFFVPFLDIKCNNMVLQKVSGIQLATGFKIKAPGSDNSLFGNLEKFGNGNSDTKIKSEKKSPNTLALVALGLGVAGLFFAIGNLKKASFIAAVFAVVALIATMIDVKSQLKTELSDSRSAGNGNNFADDVLVTIDFTAGFYLTVLVFVAAAFFGYRWIRGR